MTTLSKRLATTLALSTALVGSLSGCLGTDRTLDDYNREKAREEASKQQKVAGIYRGQIYSLKDGASLGAMTINLKPEIEAAPDQGSVSTQSKARLNGEITYLGRNKAVLATRNIYFDPETNILKATLMAGETRLDFSGDVTESGKLEGELKSLEASEYGARIVLQRDGAEPDTQALSHKDGTEIERIASAYSSNSQWLDGRNMAVNVTVTQALMTNEEAFLAALSNSQRLSMNLEINSLRYSFPSVTWDRRGGTIKGQKNLTGGQGSVLSLYCAEADAGLSCSLLDSSKSAPIFSNLLVSSSSGTPPVSKGASESYVAEFEEQVGNATKARKLHLGILFPERVGDTQADSTDEKVDLTFVTDSGIEYGFPDARWDHNSGNLIGTSSIGANRNVLTIKCSQASAFSLRCNLTSSNRGTVYNNIEFALQK